jgi:hypothetical protein
MRASVSAVLLGLAGTVSGCREADFGSSELPPCRVDSDCADASGCNGEERCNGGRCESSEAVVCPAEMECADREAVASCEFVPQSPWLIFTDDVEPGFYGMFGVPTALAGKVEPFDLNANISREEYFGVDNHEWSPDGRHLLFLPIRRDFSTRLYWMEFGRGMPSDGIPVEDLPNVGAWSVYSWSGDSRRVVVKELANDEFYQLDFSGGRPRASRFAGASWLGYCGDGVVYRVNSGKIYWAPDFEDSEPEFLGVGDGRVFADAEHVLISNEESGASLFACGTNSSGHDFEGATFTELSSDSKFAAFQTRGGLAVASVEDGREVLFIQGVSEGYWAWGESGARLLVTDVTETGETWVRLIEFPAVAVTAELSVGESGYQGATWLGPTLVLHDMPVNSGDFELNVWSPPGTPIPIPDCHPAYGIVASRDGNTVVCAHVTDTEAARVIAVDVAAGGSSRELWSSNAPVLAVEGFSPDGSQVLVETSASAEEIFSQLWLVPVSADTAEQPVRVSRGSFATTWEPWQPMP